MARILVVLGALGAVVVAAAAVWPAGSQAAPATPTQRTFVSTSGDDANPCSRAEPCRNFAAALPNTLAGGEVVALDSGGYGPFAVDKSVSVVGAPGVHAAVTAFTGNAVTISAGATDTVVLRNLYLTGLGGENGVRFITGGVLHVESVTATGFVSRGIRVTCEAGATARIVVRNGVFRHNDGGVIMNGTDCNLRFQIDGTRADSNTAPGYWFLGPVEGSVSRSTASGNTSSGFLFQAGAEVTVSDSRAEGNGNSGLATQEPPTGVKITADGVVLSNNAINGAVVGTGGLLRITGSTVTGNGNGLLNFGGTIETFGDNAVRGNVTDVAGAPITPVGKT